MRPPAGRRALAVSMLVHAVVLAPLVLELESVTPGTLAPGTGGIEVALGPAGAAPGGVPAPDVPLATIEDAAEVVPPPAAIAVPPPAADEPEVVPPPVEALEPAELAEVVPPPAEVPPPELSEAAEPPRLEAVEPLPDEAAEPLPPATAGAPVEPAATLAADEAHPVPPRPAEPEPPELVAPAEPPPEEVPPIEPMPSKPLAAVAEAEVPPEEAPLAPPTVVTATELPDPPPIPTPRPKDLAAVEPPAAPAPRRTPAPAPPGAAGRAGTEAANDVGSGDTSQGGGDPGAKADYLATLRAWLEHHKEYPRHAQVRRQQGTALLYIAIDRGGRVLASRIERSSGHSALDAAAQAMLERAAPLPPMPPEFASAPLEVLVPVQFFLR